MLAVTEVNGCAICSYAHTKMALKDGFTNEEVESFLSGSDAFIAPEEAKAILFAQHYASEKGNYDEEAFYTVIEEYGKERAEVIMAAIRMIMVGNISGIPLSAFHSRLKGKPYTHSTIGYEIGMILSTILLVPITAIHSLFLKG
jgi:AhpD family alkylhydroperoxidase